MEVGCQPLLWRNAVERKERGLKRRGVGSFTCPNLLTRDGRTTPPDPARPPREPAPLLTGDGPARSIMKLGDSP